MYKYYLLSTVIILVMGCKKDPNSDPAPTADYYISIMADNQTYLLDSDSQGGTSILNYPVQNGPFGSLDPGLVEINAKGQSPLYVNIRLNQAMSGKPETINIGGGRFRRTQFEEYLTDSNKSKAGTITFSKVDNTSAEGSFTMDVYSSGSNNSKLTLKGQFKARFVK